MPPAARIHFGDVARTAILFADHLRGRREQIQSALASYASIPAVEDEIVRATYLLDHLEENRQYFQGKVDRVAAFLPRNQLLYATVYMGVLPALMAGDCHVRPPESAHPAYRRLIQAVDFAGFFPSLHFFLEKRSEFVATKARSADVVIFTGTHANGEVVRKQLRRDALFLFSGAGHNPVIVREDAEVAQAAEAIVRLCYHNQGQDCSAPNSILAHRAIFPALYDEIRKRTLAVESAMKLGRHPHNVIAPNTDGPHLVATAEAFLKLQPFLVHGGTLEMKEQLIYPAIFRKPLAAGPHLAEFFAPVVMLQEYDDEIELRGYFEHPRYGPNAMYLTIFGRNARLEVLSDLEVHPPDTILHNRDLHVEEKGTHPYGGYGSEASFIYFAGSKRPSPILPQREIHRYLAAIHGEDHDARDGLSLRLRTAHDAQLDKVRKLEDLGVKSYAPHFVPTADCAALVERHGSLRAGESTADRVIVAGRILAYRNGGMFLDLWDASGKIQVFCHETLLGRPDLELLKLVNPGDLLGVAGTVKKTQRGELTIAADKLTVLAKDLLPALENARGAAELRGAMRRQVADRGRKLRIHAETLGAIRATMSTRRFEDAAGWMPHPKPIIVLPSAQPGGAAPPRFSALIAQGLSDRLYRIHEQVHCAESRLNSMIVVELIQAFADWRNMMALTEELIVSVATQLGQAGLLAEDASRLPAFGQASALSAIEQETGVSYARIETDEEARERARLLGCGIIGQETWGQCVVQVFARRVAPALVTPIHITRLPKDVARWAVADSDDQRLAECYATYCNGQFVSSGFTLLNDPFKCALAAANPQQLEGMDAGEDKDDDVVAAVLERGMPPSGVMNVVVAPFAPGANHPDAADSVKGLRTYA